MRFFATLLIMSATVGSLSAQSDTSRIPSLVNSPYDELNPVLSPDGTTLFFTVANHPQNTGGEKDPGDIWYSRLLNNQWSAPIHAGGILNNKHYNAVLSISVDGATFYLTGHYSSTGNAVRTQGISIAQFDGRLWTLPQNVIIPYFHNKAGILSGSLSMDENTLVVSVEGYGTHGVEDLYVSTKQNGHWTELKNLGRGVNTRFQEFSPSLSGDTKTIYFSSNGRKGKGSYDVYAATRLDDSWTNWSAPVNMGEKINSDSRELFYRKNEALGMAVFTTTKNSDGYGDINFEYFRKVMLNRDSLLATYKHDPLDSTHGKTKDKLVKIYGRITNEKTGYPVDAIISFASPKLDTTFSTTNTGSGYSIRIPSGDDYSVKILAAGYMSTMEKVITTDDQMNLDYTLKPLEIGTTISLKNVLFERSTPNLLNTSYPELDLIVSFLSTYTKVKIELAGHTDNRGHSEDNLKLSQKRVDVVKEYLVSKGIDGDRITGKGYGSTRPLHANDTEEGRQQNRRVEFTIKNL